MARIKAGFRAGDMVTVKDTAFKVNWDDTVDDTVRASYHCTAEDTNGWYADRSRAVEEAKAKGEDTFSIVMDCAGESRLPPQGGYTPFIEVQPIEFCEPGAGKVSATTTQPAAGQSCSI